MKAGRLPTETDYWRLWFTGLVLFGVRWIEMLAIAVFVYQRTGSAFLVTMLTMLRILPMALFGAFLGALLDSIDRRSALRIMLALMFLTSSALAALAFADRLEVWHLAVGAFINGAGWATDIPLRRVMIGEVIGAERMSVAMALDSGANNASRIAGPVIGGILLATVGIEGAFTLGALLYVAAMVAATGVRLRNRPVASYSAGVLARIVEGVRLVRRDRHMGGIFVVTAIYNLFGWPSLSLVPVIGSGHFALDPKAVGVLASMDGIGAIAGATLVAIYARPQDFQRIYVGSVALFMTMLATFALSPDVRLAGAVLVLTGFGSSSFAIMQTTLIYRGSTPQMRMRLLGLLSVCIGVGPLGFLQLGLLAETFGPRLAIVIISVEGLLALAFTHRLWRQGPEPATPAG
jgi:MFS family permease